MRAVMKKIVVVGTEDSRGLIGRRGGVEGHGEERRGRRWRDVRERRMRDMRERRGRTWRNMRERRRG